MHKLAKLTPKSREDIAKSSLLFKDLCKLYPHVHPNTIRKWRKRKDYQDRPSINHTRRTVMSAWEEELILLLRKECRLSLEDLTHVVQKHLNPKISRSAIHRALQRHNCSHKLDQPEVTAKKEVGQFDDTTIGFLHIDVKYLPRMCGESRHTSYAYVAIDRVSRYVVVQIRNNTTRADAAEFLEYVVRQFPHKIHTIITDNGSEFTDRFMSYSTTRWGNRWGNKSQPSGRHLFDMGCQKHGIEHRLTKVRKPQTNGMVERFNRRIAEVLRSMYLKFANKEEMSDFILQFAANYNNTPLAVLNYDTPYNLVHNPERVYNEGTE